jgi:hypothetical protein
MGTSGSHDVCDRVVVTANEILGNLPELIAFWRSLGEEHFVIITLPDDRYVQMLVTKDGEVVCEVIADEFMPVDLHWNLRQRSQLREHFEEPLGKPKSSPNWHYCSSATDATLEGPTKAAVALYKVLRLRPSSPVTVDQH